jgi:glycosyltransferase involved in cell wall biosynthesis
MIANSFANRTSTMKVSVVIASKNNEEKITQALDSVLEQSLTAYEIIVVDDRSADSSAEIAAGFGEAVTVISEKFGSKANAKNYGAHYASGDAILLMTAEDLLGPNAIKHLSSALKENLDGIVACPWYYRENGDENWIRYTIPQDNGNDLLSKCIEGRYHASCSVLWSTSAFKKVGGFDALAGSYADWDIMMRAVLEGIYFDMINNGAVYAHDGRMGGSAEYSGAGGQTRKERKAKLYVLQKITHRLYEKNELSSYRKSFSIALDTHRKLCAERYPDLDAVCLDLMKRYGEPMPQRLLQGVRKKLQDFVKKVTTKTSNLQDEHGSVEAKKYLKRKKHSSTGTKSDVKSSDHVIRVTEIEDIHEYSSSKKDIPNPGSREKAGPKNPDVSVILAVLDSEDSIETAVESVLAQDFEDFELLIVAKDADSKPGAPLQNTDAGRVRYIPLHDPGFTSAYLNAGMREAKGKYIAFMSPNDEWNPDKLAREVELFNNVTETIGMVYSGIMVKSRSGDRNVFRHKLKKKSYRRLLVQNKMHGPSGLTIRRNVLATVGFFDEKLPMMETHDYILRTSRYHKFEYSGKILLSHHSSSGLGRKPSHIDYIIEGRRLFFEKHHLDMREEKAAQIFLLHSSRLQLKKRTKAGRKAARRLALQAFKEDPLNRSTYRLIYNRFYNKSGKKGSRRIS